jgi:hypothetical protein
MLEKALNQDVPTRALNTISPPFTFRPNGKYFHVDIKDMRKFFDILRENLYIEGTCETNLGACDVFGKMEQQFDRFTECNFYVLDYITWEVPFYHETLGDLTYFGEIKINEWETVREVDYINDYIKDDRGNEYCLLYEGKLDLHDEMAKEFNEKMKQ